MTQPPFLIYIVDDDEDDLLFIHGAFKDLGLDNACKGFLSGVELLQHLRFSSSPLPDAVILDFEMPRMNGKDILKSLKSTPEYASVPVIFYSDKITPDLEKDLVEMGAFCCIKKGISASDQLKFAQAVTGFLKK